MNKQMHRSVTRRLVALALALMIVLPAGLAPRPAPAAGAIIHINVNAAEGGDGASWSTAYKYLQDALAAATSGDEIWVAQGIYYPDEGAGVTANDRIASFTLKGGVSLYGGFAGTETSRSQRNWNANLSVLSGDIDQNDSGKVNGVLQDHSGITGANSYHVVAGSNLVGQAIVLDGFSITGGDAAQPELYMGGGGIKLDRVRPILLENLTVRGNRATAPGVGQGGGIFTQSSSLTVRRSVIRNNLALGAGGGMALVTPGGTTIEATHILQNEFRIPNPSLANACLNLVNGGGGVFAVNAGNVTLQDVVIEENVGDCVGGGMAHFQGGLEMHGGAFLNNHVRYIGFEEQTNGGGFYGYNVGGSMDNVLVMGNASDREGGGIYLGNARAARIFRITNSTIVANSAVNLSALLARSDRTGSLALTLKNVIIWANGTGGANGPLLADGNATLSIGNSLVQGSNGSGGSWNPKYGTDLGGNIDTDPGFIQPPVGGAPNVSGNFRLSLGSPAIDVGLNAAMTLPTDNDGNPRIFNSVVDMGAYEVQVVCPAAGTTRLYVDATASGAGLGTSWADALPRLQDALTLANRCPSNSISEVWVAQGTYYPDDGVYQTDGDRTAAFQLKNGLSIYGGFLGSETSLSQRNPWSYITTLSGDIGQDDKTDANDLVETPADIVAPNSYHVVVASGTGATARLDGFAVTGGQANGGAASRQNEGGGLFAEGGSPTLNNLAFVGNIAEEGGAMTLVGGSNPAISNAGFGGNAATEYGGALHNEGSNPTLVNVQMSGNRAAAGGGAIYNLASSPELTNVTIAGNAAGNTVSAAAAEIAPTGGGILNLTGSKPDMRNSIIWANQDASGTGTPSSSIRNLDVSSTPSADYSDIQGLASISGLIFDGTSKDADPLFVIAVNPASAPAFTPPLKLKAGSPAIDAGNDSFNSQPLDLDLRPRIQGAAIDMGAFEATPAPHVALHKSVNTPTAQAGETITYTYQVVNTGLVTLTAISASDDRLGVINFGVSEVAPSASATASLTYTVVEGDLPGPLTNLATVTATSSVSGTVVATDTAAVGISYRPKIAVTVAPNVNSALPGTTVTYTVQVKNMGDVSLTAVAATDSRLGAVTLDTTVLAPGATATGILTYTVQSSDLPGPLVDTVTGSGRTPLSAQVTGTDSATVSVIDPNPPPPYALFFPSIQKQ